MILSPSLTARLGTISYIIWAVLHLFAAASVYRLGLEAGATMVGGRLLQDAWNLGAFSLAGAGVAISLNWRNSIWGYWINLAVISVADLGFILFVLLPGYVPFWQGIVGPVFWVLGLMATSVAQIGLRVAFRAAL